MATIADAPYPAQHLSSADASRLPPRGKIRNPDLIFPGQVIELPIR